jgi:hypothetical protein
MVDQNVEYLTSRFLLKDYLKNIESLIFGVVYNEKY